MLYTHVYNIHIIYIITRIFSVDISNPIELILWRMYFLAVSIVNIFGRATELWRYKLSIRIRIPVVLNHNHYLKNKQKNWYKIYCITTNKIHKHTIPNTMEYQKTTHVPNELFDTYLPKLSFSELKILLYIIRQTYGWKLKNGKRKQFEKHMINFIKKLVI